MLANSAIDPTPRARTVQRFASVPVQLSREICCGAVASLLHLYGLGRWEIPHYKFAGSWRSLAKDTAALARRLQHCAWVARSQGTMRWAARTGA